MGRNEDIKNYLRGNRKGKAANRLERDALSDPFLFEALEGLTSTAGDPMDGLIRLERQLEERARVSPKKRRGWLYAAASLLVLVMCGTLWMMQTQERVLPVDKVILSNNQQIAPPLGSEPAVALSLANDSSVMKEGGAAPKKTVKVAEVKEEVALTDALPVDELGVRAIDGEQRRALALKTTVPVATNVVEGVVIDKEGKPIPGVSVVVSGTTVGVSTDVNGRFSLSLAQPEAQLTFNFIGMKSHGCKVKAGERVRVEMEEELNELEEVVVTGYQTKMKKAIVGSATTLKVKEVDSLSLYSSEDVFRFNLYLEKALQYPQEDLDKNNEGTIEVSFELNKKKVPSRIRIKEGFSKASNKEVIRLLSHGPGWVNSRSGKRLYATVRFSIGKDGEQHKAMLTVVPRPDGKRGD